MSNASFCVELTDQNRSDYASLTGDFNPLHTDESYARNSNFGRCILHGAFSAGLFSRLAGMNLPGRDCLLHGMTLRFFSPIVTPIKVIVEGRIVRDDGQTGEVVATVREQGSGRLFVEGRYQFGRHLHSREFAPSSMSDHAPRKLDASSSKILVTGANGGLGHSICEILGEKSLPVSRGPGEGFTTIKNLSEIDAYKFNVPLDGIVHCAWPQPTLDGLLDLPNPSDQIEHHLTDPIKHCLALARLLRSQGRAGALLILVGSSYSIPGRHGWRMPLYSLSKGIIPNLVKILALELASTKQVVVGVTLDVIKGGMNRGISPLRSRHILIDLLGENYLTSRRFRSNSIGY